MSISQRLADLDENLRLWYQKLAAMESSLAMAADPEIKISIQQRIQREIAPNIRDTEAEYWGLLAQAGQSCAVAEEDARNAIAPVAQEVKLIENNRANYPDNFMKLLQEIREKLDEPGTPVAAKAKLALSLVPGFLSYEVELDTESSLKRVFFQLKRAFEPLKNLFKEALKKN